MNEFILLKNYISLAFIDEGNILVSRKNKIYIYNINNNSFEFILSLPNDFFHNFILNFSILSRIFRADIRLAVQIKMNSYLVVFNKYFYRVDIRNKKYEKVFLVPRGRRPLSITNVQNVKNFSPGLYFGEYFQNFDKCEVNIYRTVDGSNWEIIYTFPKGTIEHIHGIVEDSYHSCLWILTGDFGNASAIWMAKNDFKLVEPILLGDQIFRSCVAFPTKFGLLYATDSQFEKNSIRILKKSGNKWLSLFIYEINGPAIYGCQIGDKYYFSTSVEGNLDKMNKILKYLDKKPGPGILENYSHIIEGDLDNGFSTIFKAQKDILPFIIFQFGVFTFPTGENNTSTLVVNPVGLKGLKSKSLIFNYKKT
jgi:hypothetical protein